MLLLLLLCVCVCVCVCVCKRGRTCASKILGSETGQCMFVGVGIVVMWGCVCVCVLVWSAYGVCMVWYVCL